MKYAKPSTDHFPLRKLLPSRKELKLSINRAATINISTTLFGALNFSPRRFYLGEARQRVPANMTCCSCDGIFKPEAEANNMLRYSEHGR